MAVCVAYPATVSSDPMYNEFFGLKESPFSIAPDPRYLFMSERHREALAHLLYGLGGGGGFVLLTGEIGAGKTTVCRCFLEQIPGNCNVAYIFNPKLTVLELLRAILDEFHVDYPKERNSDATVTDYVAPLNQFLLDAHAQGRNNVLIIDEAQNLSAEVIEQLRLLTNLETSERKLLQIVLIGQPELRTMLARPDMEQLAQRVIARFHLPALSETETAHYVAHRLAVAGRVAEAPFDRVALQRIHKLSRGVPRRINLLCDRSPAGRLRQRTGAAARGPGADANLCRDAERPVRGHRQRGVQPRPGRPAARLPDRDRLPRDPGGRLHRPARDLHAEPRGGGGRLRDAVRLPDGPGQPSAAASRSARRRAAALLRHAVERPLHLGRDGGHAAIAV